MRKTAGMWRIAAVAALAIVVACATGREATEGALEPVQIVVENDLDVPSSVSVSIFTEGGMEVNLGSVEPGEERTFTYDRATMVGKDHRLVATTTGGAEIVSRDFHLQGGETLRWSLDENTLI